MITVDHSEAAREGGVDGWPKLSVEFKPRRVLSSGEDEGEDMGCDWRGEEGGCLVDDSLPAFIG